MLLGFILGFILGLFLMAYMGIPRFRVGFHKGIIAALNGLDKALNVKKKEEPKNGRKTNEKAK